MVLCPQMHGLLSYIKRCICQSSLEEVRLWPFHSFSAEWFHFCWLHSSDFPIKFHLSKVFQSKIKPNQTGTDKPGYWPWDQETSKVSPIKTQFSSLLLSHQSSVSERLLQRRGGSQPAGLAFAALLLCCLGLSTISPGKRELWQHYTAAIPWLTTFTSWPMSYYVLMVKSTGFGLRYIDFKSWFLLMVSFLSVT